MIYKATPYHKNPCPGDHAIYNFSRPFLGPHFYTYFVWTIPQSKEENYLHVKNTSILHYLSQNYLSLEWGVMKFPYLTDATHQFG